MKFKKCKPIECTRELDRYGIFENYARMKRETEKLKAQDAYDFFYGDRE